jgi:predicted amidohydrolase
MKIGVVQFKPTLFDVKNNLKKALKIMENSSAELFILPELAFSGYLFNSKNEVEEVVKLNDFVENKMTTFSKEKSCAVVFGYPEKSEDKFYNSSMLILPNERKRNYRKTHLFFEEKHFFTPGDTGFFVEEFRGVKVGLAICFDWFFPESFRTLALMGADVIAHSANLVMPYCQDSNVYASLQNRVYIATANRWGKDKNGEKSLEFTGKSQVTSPMGKIMARAPEKDDTILEVDVDVSVSRDKHLNPLNNVFEDRQPTFYLI